MSRLRTDGAGALEVPLADAIADAPGCAAILASMAAGQRMRQAQVDQYQTLRDWVPAARTFCYHTHIAVSAQPAERLTWLAAVFFNAATLSAHPWYPQFKGGKKTACDADPAHDITAHHLALGCIDLGLRQPRYYRQLVSLARPDASTAVIVARSVAEGPELPAGARLAYTLAPNGEVLHWENGRLHWHHICCTPGAGLLPARADRWLINTIRRLRLDGTERKTYREEAEQLRDWLHGENPQNTLSPRIGND